MTIHEEHGEEENEVWEGRERRRRRRRKEEEEVQIGIAVQSSTRPSDPYRTFFMEDKMSSNR